jgi:hypothetical protein
MATTPAILERGNLERAAFTPHRFRRPPDPLGNCAVVVGTEQGDFLIPQSSFSVAARRSFELDLKWHQHLHRGLV